MTILQRSALLACIMATCSLAWANPAATDDAARLQKAAAHPGTIAAGKRAAFLCVYCHGEDGNSMQESIPNLAGQNPNYLLTQIEKFGDGRRYDQFMSGLIKELSMEDRVAMALYYASMQPKPAPVVDAALAEKGRKRYLAICLGCHGPQAHGNSNIARLAGQHTAYLTQALTSYRTRGSARNDPTMSQIARRLASDDILTIASYLSTLR